MKKSLRLLIVLTLITFNSHAQNTQIQKADFGSGFTIGFSFLGKGYALDGNSFWEYTPPPAATCNIPTSPLNGNITSTTAKLKWETVNGTMSYKIRYKIAGTSEYTIIKSIYNHKTLNGLTDNTNYTWQVKSLCEIDPVVSSEWSAKQFFTTAPLKISDEQSPATLFVRKDSFGEIYPNPFSSSTTISFSVYQDSQIQIELLDIAGRKLSTLFNENVAAGNHEFNFDRDQLSSGIYFIKFLFDGPDKSGQDEVMMKKVVVE
ncbi:MAG: T9SS type A sorting domain-containing protein [Chitinophagales bacterium]